MRKIFICIAIVLALASCNKQKKPKSAGTYVDFDLHEGGPAMMEDKSLNSQPIIIPRAVGNEVWKNSSFSLHKVPENISSKSSLVNATKFNLYNSASNKDINRSAVINDQAIFVLDNANNVYAYSVSNPKDLLWKVNLSPSKNEFIGGGIALDGDYIAVTYGNKDLVLLNAKNGKVIWRYNLSNISRAAPVIYQRSVFVLTVDNKLYCIELDSGLLKWTHESANEQFGIINNVSPEGSEGLVIVPYSSGQVDALDSAGGEAKWEVMLSSNLNQAYLNGISMTPVVANNSVYISNHNGALFSVHLTDGSVEWTNQNAGGGSSIWVAGDHIYSINKSNQLLAVHKTTGGTKWVQDLVPKDKKKKKTKFSGPIMVNGNLYVASSNGQFMTIAAKTGKILNEVEISKGIYSPLVAVGGAIYLLSNSGNLLVIN